MSTAATAAPYFPNCQLLMAAFGLDRRSSDSGGSTRAPRLAAETKRRACLQFLDTGPHALGASSWPWAKRLPDVRIEWPAPSAHPRALPATFHSFT